MKNLTFIVLVALLVGATNNLFAQESLWELDAIVYPEEWQCVSTATSEEEDDDYLPEASLIETPYGILLYGRFTEINNETYNAAAIFTDTKITNVPFSTSEFEKIYDVGIIEDQVILTTDAGIYSWYGGTDLIPWGIDIDIDLDIEWIHSKIIKNFLVISGGIDYINGESAFAGIFDIESRSVFDIIDKYGYFGTDFDILGDSIFFGYFYDELSPDMVSFLIYNIETKEVTSPEIPFVVAWVNSIEEYNGALYFGFHNPIDITERFGKFDGENWVMFSDDRTVHLFEFSGMLFSSPGPLKMTEDGVWSVMVDSDSTYMTEKVFFVNGSWYGVSIPGILPFVAEWGDYADPLCFDDKFIAKLGEPDIEVEVADEKNNFSELQIFFSGENLVVKSNLTENFILKVYDLTGKLLLSKMILPGQTSAFPLEWNSGLYVTNTKQKILKL